MLLSCSLSHYTGVPDAIESILTRNLTVATCCLPGGGETPGVGSLAGGAGLAGSYPHETSRYFNPIEPLPGGAS